MTNLEKRNWTGALTRVEMVRKILDDMVGTDEKARHAIERRWKGWLSRQTKEELQKIMTNRGI